MKCLFDRNLNRVTKSRTIAYMSCSREIHCNWFKFGHNQRFKRFNLAEYQNYSLSVIPSMRTGSYKKLISYYCFKLMLPRISTFLACYLFSTMVFLFLNHKYAPLFNSFLHNFEIKNAIVNILSFRCSIIKHWKFRAHMLRISNLIIFLTMPSKNLNW